MRKRKRRADRPFARQDGMGELFSGEIPFALWLERRGYDVTYTTDYDLSIRPAAQRAFW